MTQCMNSREAKPKKVHGSVGCPRIHLNHVTEVLMTGRNASETIAGIILVYHTRKLDVVHFQL